MSDGTRYAARYFDGKTARAQDVSIALTEEGIAIYRQTGILLATWASGNIVLAERPRRGEAARIGLEGTTARLIVEDPGVIEQLSEIAPAAHRRIRRRASKGGSATPRWTRSSISCRACRQKAGRSNSVPTRKA
jgi:hypothetical protein